MDSTRIEHHIKAPRAVVYRALPDPRAVAQWKVPDGMTCHVHAFPCADARLGSHRLVDAWFLAEGSGGGWIQARPLQR